MKNYFLLFILFSVTIILSSEIQAQPYYYRSGDPTQTVNWGNVPDGTGTPPSSFNLTTEYIIGSGKTANVVSSWFWTGSSTLRVVDGGTLINNSAIFINGSCNFCLNDGATYIHNTIFSASGFIFGGNEAFEPNSNIIIKNWSSANDPLWAGINNTATDFYFGNLEVNWTNGSGDWFQNLTASNVNWCAGDFKITNLGNAILIPNPSLGGTGIEVVVKGNFIQNNGDFELSRNPGHGANHLIICKDFYKTGGKFHCSGLNTGFILFEGTRVNYPDYQTIFCNDTLDNIKLGANTILKEKVRLISNLFTTQIAASEFATLFGIGGTIIDFGTYLFKTNGTLGFNGGNVKFQFGSPYGADSNLICYSIAAGGYKEYEFNGTGPQVIGKNLLSMIPYGTLQALNINNSFGVTLNSNLIVSDTIKFSSGILNLEDYNLRVDNQNGTGFKGVTESSYVNQTGTGVLKQYLVASKKLKYPVGNNSFTPFSIFMNSGSTPDTTSIKVFNDFPYASVYDTSRMVKKCWYINKPSGTPVSFQVEFQWQKSAQNLGRNFNLDSMMAGINQSLTYEVLRLLNWDPTAAIYTVPNSTTVTTNSSLLNNFNSAFLDLNNRYFVFGNDNGILHQYYYNSGEASDPNSWIDPLPAGGLIHPPDLNQTGVYNIANNKTAIFNSPVTIGNNASRLRASGNAVIQANAPITCYGKLQLYDSSSYNHNNTSQLKTTLFAGEEYFSSKSNFNILKWSDTTDKVTDGLITTNSQRYFYGNLTIDFNNLLHPTGTGSWGPQFSDDVILRTLTSGDFNLKQCSGFLFAPSAPEYSSSSVEVSGSVNIGDTLNPVNPGINLSYLTKKSSDSSSVTLYIGKNLYIYNGGITSEQPYNKARGRIAFIGGRSHYFYQNPEFFYSMSNLGCEVEPNIIAINDTLILKSNFYNSTNNPFNLPDVLKVDGVLDCGVYKLNSVNVRLSEYGKILIKSPEGMNWKFSPIQSFTHDPKGRIEFCGSVPQLSGTGMPDLNQLTINNPSGVTFNKAITISDTLNLRAGRIFTDSANSLTLLSTTRLNNTDTSTGIIGSAAVRFTSPGSYLLPLGNGGAINFIQLYTQAGDETTFQVDCHSNNPYDSVCLAPLTNIHRDIWFRVTRTSAGTPMNSGVAFGWNQPIGVTDITNLRVAKWDGTQWVSCGLLSYAGNPNNGAIYSDYLSSFSPFTIGSIDNQQLPVELSSFTSQVNGNKLNLLWSTTMEQNNSGFEIQRALVNNSNDSLAYTKIGFVNGSGNSNSIKNYSFDERNLSAGKYKYRLKQIDFNGNYKYYQLASEITIGVPAKYKLSQNYPNPFNPVSKIDVEFPEDTKADLVVYDMTGREVMSLFKSESFSSGYYTFNINGAGLASGAYFYRLTTAKFSNVKKMMLVK